jgi:hypothetical protein
MKKRFITIFVMVFLTLGLLTACGDLSGTYIYVGDDYAMLGEELEFDGNEMKYMDYLIAGYKIKDDEIRITAGDSVLEFEFYVDGDSIFIEGNEYAREGSDRYDEWEKEQEVKEEQERKEAREAIVIEKNEIPNPFELLFRTTTAAETTALETTTEPVPDQFPDVKPTINVNSFTTEVPEMFNRYFEVYPDRYADFDINTTVIATIDGAYEPALDQALAAGTVDLYCVESTFALKYTQGDFSSFAAPYKDLGINVDGLITAGDIAQYTIDIGTNPDGDVIGLGYQSAAGAFIYRSSIAFDTWGTDDPDIIAAKIGPGWDKFLNAAAELKDKGYGIVSGNDGLWRAVENSSSTGWVVRGELTLSPERLAFFDITKILTDNGYHNHTLEWTDSWYNDMQGIGEQPVFGFFGPAWFINYTLAPNCGGTVPGEGTYGDWRVCEPPTGFFWGGTWLLAAKDSPHKEVIGEFIEWVTLETHDMSLQYYWANGNIDISYGNKDAVTSAVVMKKSNGSLDILGGQNMFDAYIPANDLVRGDNLTEYDAEINGYFQDAVRMYAYDEADKETAITWFKQTVADNTTLIVE